MKRLVGRAEIADSLEELLGVEGLAARIYFSLFAGMLKRGDHWDRDPTVCFDFQAGGVSATAGRRAIRSTRSSRSATAFLRKTSR